MDEEEGKPGGAGVIAEDAMSRFSLDASAGGRHSTLLDEYERLAFEAQLNRAIVLRRCYSEPSPVRVVAQPQPRPQEPADGDDQQGEAPRRDGGGGRFWRLHEVLGRCVEALRPAFRWLRAAWERRRRKEPDTARRPPPTVPRVQLLDYLRD
ncbi:hypothetical protein HU200_024188 [Digitaria exilis]|uniref:Uncharacterized protein n=1 Tax=Digitaria exilis TaxID=1010633 RepID=A0A835EWT0_9POAL|nr:hypothetical protein HU200_024188 [Digitaria exilis]